MKKLEKLILIGIVAIVILRPIIFWLMPAFDIKVPIFLVIEKDWSHNIIEFLILATALFWILKLALIKNAAIGKLPVDRFILGFLLICGLSLLYSVNRDLSLRSLLLLFSHAAFFYLLVHTLDRDAVARFCGLFVGLATALSLYGLYESFFLYRFIGEHIDMSFLNATARNMISLRRVSSVFGWPNRLAGFLGMAIPVSIGLLLHENRPKFRILLSACTILMSACMLVTFSIGGWLSFLGALIFAAILSFWFMGTKLREFILNRRIFMGLTALLLIVVLVTVGWIITEKRANTVTAGAIECRIAYLKGSLGLIRNNLLLGTGLGTFRLAYPQYMPAKKVYGTQHAHNIFLEIWSEMGLAGVILFLIFIGLVINTGIREFSNTENQEHRFVVLGLITGITAFLLHNIIEFTFYSPEVSLYWWLLLGLLFVYPVRKAESSAQDELSNGVYTKERTGVNYISKAGNKIALLAVTAILLFLALLTLKNNFIGDLHFFNGIRFIKSGELREGLKAYKKALRFNSQDSRYHHNLGMAYWLIGVRGDGGEQSLYKAEREYEEAIRLNPRLAQAHHDLANIYLQTNRPSQAIEGYKKAIELNHAFVKALHNLGVIYDSTGRPDQAKEEFEKAIRIDPDFTPSRRYLKSGY